MLEILNDLEVFFEDCYREVSVREYAKLRKISPPTASTRLSEYKNLGLLQSEEQRRALLYSVNRDSVDFMDLCRMYWRNKLAALTEHLVHALVTPTVILFGSLAKAEGTAESDVDLAIFAKRKEVAITKYEKKLGRSIQVLFFGSFSEVPQELAQNILNGYVLSGRLRWIGNDVVKNES